MKAIAFAIICAAYLLLPAAEFDKYSENMKRVHSGIMIICVVGFWLNILFEGNK